MYFNKHYGLVFDGKPSLESDIEKSCDMDGEVKASGFLKEQLGKDIKNVTKLFDKIADEFLDNKPEGEGDGEEDSDSEEEENEN